MLLDTDVLLARLCSRQRLDPPSAPALADQAASPARPQGSLLCPSESLSEASLGLSLSCGPEASEGPVDHFPCIADELEEQAKQLEEDWFCPSLPLAAAAAAAKAAQSGRLSPALGPRALRDTALEALQQHLAAEAEVAATAAASPEQACTSAHRERSLDARGGAAHDEPCTPQRHSKGDSSWNESLPCGMDYGEVQSPAPAKLLTLPSPAAPAGTTAHCRPPLAVAIENAQRVRLGQTPLPGAWRGCGRSAWCSLEPRHAATCTVGASVPGLLAYPSEELFESGVNIEELCRVPDELAGSLAPGSELGDDAGACASGGGADCLSSGKRRAEAEADDGASHSQSGAGGCASSDGCAEAVAKRVRTDACSSFSGVAAITAAAFQPSPAAMAAAAAAEAASGACAATMVPVEVPPPRCLAVPQFAPPVPPLGSAMARNRGRPAGAPRLRPLQPALALPPPPPPAAPLAPTPTKPVTRQKQHSTPAGVGTGERRTASRPAGRKAVVTWHTDSVTDPRTGAAVTVVQPGTFCTQCHALSTPVWRAGPFGHKTLCNACGVRWMKASKGSKK